MEKRMAEQFGDRGGEVRRGSKKSVGGGESAGGSVQLTEATKVRVLPGEV